eukprot:8155914-Alexandrium_andersonii.AAC.1
MLAKLREAHGNLRNRASSLKVTDLLELDIKDWKDELGSAYQKKTSDFQNLGTDIKALESLYERIWKMHRAQRG